MRKAIASFVAFSMISTSAYANDDFVKGLMGAMIGAAIAGQAAKSNNTSRSQPAKRKTSSKPTISSAERAENKKLQEDLNYFGFNAGTPDGVLGRKTSTAVSQLQICLNRPITGKIDSFERQFLSQSAFKAQANGAETLRLIAQMPNGYCGLLQKYLLDLTAPKPTVVAQPPAQVIVQQQQAPVVVQQQPIAPVARVAPVAQQMTVNNTNVTNIKTENNVYVIDEKLQRRFDRLANELKLLSQIEKHVEARTQDAQGARKLKAIREHIARLRLLVASVQDETEEMYGTPIRPTNANLGITAVKASEVFPRVPYFIPGTEEKGELWIKPYVSDSGSLMYDFNFIDDTSDFDKILETIQLNEQNITSLADSMLKINQWSDKAVEQGLRRRYEKVADCFPITMCAEKIEGNSSTEFVFLIYEDGSTAAAIRRNKGRYNKNFNMSVESGLLLSAYADYMSELGSKDFMAATMTDAELDNLFE